MKKKGGYSHARHVDQVLKASSSKYVARAILLDACRRSDFHSPEVVFTKEQLQETIGYCWNSIKAGLQELRAEGSIVPIAHFEGGRGRAVRYRLEVVGQGGQEGDNDAGQGARACPPEIFSRWTKMHGYEEARRRRRLYEQGEDFED